MSKAPYHAVFVLPAFHREPIGGYVVVYNYANYLARSGWLVDILYPRSFDRPASALARLKRRLWPIATMIKNRPLVPWFNFAPGVRLQLLREWRFSAVPDADVVIATGWQTASPVSQLPARKGTKFYLVQHHEIWSGSEEDVNATYRLPLKVIAISKWLVGVVTEHGAHSVAHIPNGLDHTQFRNLGRERSVQIISLYHHLNYKGVGDAIDALEKVREAMPNLRATMFGTPPRGAEIPGWIEYVQGPTGEKLVELYNSALIYLSASLKEGWALPPAEAMACGCLFVGTDSGGCRDFAEDGGTALLSPPSDPNRLASNLIYALSGEPRIEAIRKRGEKAIQEFTWERSGKALCELFVKQTSQLPPAKLEV
jgi:glycosyltransferase involved in cell wall biosynthesis